MLKTKEEFRKRGFGRVLVSKVVKEAEKLGFIPMCHIEEDNVMSANFFLNLGFHKGIQANWVEHLFKRRNN